MDIICHAFPAWEGNYVKSTVELMKAAAHQGHRVLYVDYAYTWTDFVKSLLGKGHASWRRMLGLQPRLRREGMGDTAPYVLTLPPVLPANFLKNPRLHDAVNRWNSFFVGRHIRRATRSLDMDAPTVVNAFNPGFGTHLAGKLGEKRLVYYCYDEIGAANWAGRHGARLEQQLVQQCDAVIVSSEGLQQKQQARHDSVFVVKNGVDADLFFADIPADQLPEVPSHQPGEKIVGYLGSVDDRLDFDLLERLFRQFSDARFVFVGRVQNESVRARLVAFPNVFLAGAYPPAALPGWVARMDVCLIPFVKNEFTAGIYPLKINEYLAAGKPVVSTHFAPLGEFSGIATIADTPEIFEGGVGAALRESNQQEADALPVKEQRRAFARQNSWAERANLFMGICHQNPG